MPFRGDRRLHMERVLVLADMKADDITSPGQNRHETGSLGLRRIVGFGAKADNGHQTKRTRNPGHSTWENLVLLRTPIEMSW